MAYSRSMQAAIERRKARERFMQARVVERDFGAKLANAGREVGRIVRGFTDNGKIKNGAGLRQSLDDYSKTLRPWAKAVTERMQAQVSRHDLTAWKRLSESMGSQLHREITKTPVGLYMRDLLDEQVGLITSLPIEAAQRVHELTMRAITQGTRSPDIAREIMRTGEVTEARARLIARTEVSRTSTTLTQARATFVGSEGYLWRGILDEVERKQHVKLEGKFIRWDSPPIAGVGKGGVPMRYHAGCGPNCRCYAEPVIPNF